MNPEFIEFLVKEGALKFGDFTLKSGRKSPYFVNTGVVCSGSGLYRLAGFFARKILETGTAPIVYGPAYKGIPLAVAASISLADEHGFPNSWLFNRKEVKAHGDKGAFVGRLPQEGEEVILIDDVFTTGGTKYESVELLQAMGAKVKSLIIGVDREEKGESKNAVEEFREKTRIPVHSIAKISDCFEYLKGKGIDGKVHVTDELYAAFREYRDEYGT
ncbi:orotate phosphoribosyltransferase [Candidatus Micrarchaeota archaeon]|nr:orotate phosphoribosyltransferase [Candidatus Micrarchaeota archaeon]MBD3418055.1 orotate phosphoribosyltransferase [Candidatus Micrarchaeota archaeon]